MSQSATNSRTSIHSHIRNVLNLLDCQYFLSGLNEDLQHRLLQTAHRRHLHANERLFLQGDSAEYFYVVLTGRIKLFRISEDGDEKVMGLAGAQASFAEGILFMDNPHYPVDAQAIEPTDLIALKRQTYLSILSESFPTCLSVMSEFTGRIQNLLNEIESLTLRDSRYRVVKFLADLLPKNASNATTVKLPARKSTIAARLSIRPETLSRAFRVLSNEELITIKDEQVVIHNPPAFRALVNI